MNSLPPKPFLSIDEQITRLRSRGMELDHPPAAQWLRAIGYYRLSSYWHSYQEPNPNDPLRPHNAFIPGTSFAEVARLYEFDRHLKNKILNGLERVEVAMRSQVGHVLGRIDPMAHEDPLNFRPEFDHADWSKTANSRIGRSRNRDQSVDHHFDRYGGRLPIWVLTDILDFSDVSKLFKGMWSANQSEVSDWFSLGNLPPNPATSPGKRKKQPAEWRENPPLASWLIQLSIVRNICAHHSRLWNRHLTPASASAFWSIEEFNGVPNQSERVFGALCMVGFLLQTASPGSSWILQVKQLVEDSFANLDHRSPAEMGFPEKWTTLPLWASRDVRR